MPSQILITVLQMVSMFYLTIVLLRFLLQLARADFYNPISQFAVKITNPLLRPLRRVVPGWGGIDGAALVLALLIQALVLFLILLTLNHGIPAISPVTLLTTMLAWSVLAVLSLVVKVYFWSIIAVVIVSWVAPGSHHPAIQLVSQITEPVMRPVRKIMPSVGGLDLSPIIVFMILNVLSMIIQGMAVKTGLASIWPM